MIAVKCGKCGQSYPKGAGHRCGVSDSPSEANDNDNKPPWKEREAEYMKAYDRGYKAGYRAASKRGAG